MKIRDGQPQEFIQCQRRLLEALFGPRWFTPDRRDHPAFKRWCLCKRLLRCPLSIPSDVERLPEIAEMLLDNLNLATATGGGSFEFGNFANYGDELVQKRLKAVIVKPQQFLDVLVEVSYAAWNVGRGHDVQVFEDSGFPDFQITIPRAGLRLATDCKRVRVGTGEQRLRKVITKANAQIKALNGNCHGLVVIDVSSKTPATRELRQREPTYVLRAQQKIGEAIRRYNTAVSGVVLSWRDATIIPMTDGSGGTLCVMRQHGKLLRHRAPLHELPMQDEALIPAFTTAFQVHPS